MLKCTQTSEFGNFWSIHTLRSLASVKICTNYKFDVGQNAHKNQSLTNVKMYKSFRALRMLKCRQTAQRENVKCTHSSELGEC